MGAIIYKNELKHICFEETFGVTDYDWILRLFHQRNSVEVCKMLYTRRISGKNLSLDEEYRRKDFYYSLSFIERYADKYAREVKTAYLKIHGSRARYYYLVGNMKKARFYFLRANLNWKTLLYYITTFVGSSWVKKHFNVFG